MDLLAWLTTVSATASHRPHARGAHGLFDQLGDASTTDRWSPFPVSGLADVAEMSGGEFHFAARMASGAFWTWGQNSCGQLGTGDTPQNSVHVPVPGLAVN